MSITDSTHRASLVARVKGILLQPKAEWDRIDVEPATVQGLFTGYAVPLAAIGPVCSILASALFLHFALPFIIGATLVGYVLALAATFVIGLIIDALAPTFGGVKNQVQAMKVAVYGSTAAWVAGVFNLIPGLGAVLVFIGLLYGLYLYYTGLPKLMKTSADKALGYTALTVVCYVVISWIIMAIVGSIMVMGAVTGGMGAAGVLGANTGAVRVGDATVNLAALTAASKQMEASANAMQAQALAARSGATAPAGTAVAAASPDALKALLPAGMMGYARGDVSAESSAAAGMSTSHAEAVYTKGASTIRLNVADAGAMGALTGMASALGVNADKRTATGYERISTAGGRTVSEEWDGAAKRGKVAVMAGRMIVSAEGEGASMDEVKAAANAVDAGRLAALAKG